MTEEERREKKRQYNRDYLELNRERIRQHQREYYEANREKCNAKSREGYLKNLDDRNAYSRAYRMANKERINAQRLAYREANRDAILERQRDYVARNREAVNERQKLRHKAARLRDPERYREASRRSYDKHCDEIHKKQKAYRATPEVRVRDRERAREYKEANPEKVRDSSRRYAMRKRQLRIASSDVRNSERDRVNTRQRLNRINAVISADRNGLRWTKAEDSIVLQEGLTDIERACILHRSYSAVTGRRYLLLNPAKVREARVKNKGNTREYHRERYACNRELILAKNRETYRRDRGKIAERRRELRAAKQAVA